MKMSAVLKAAIAVSLVMPVWSGVALANPPSGPSAPPTTTPLRIPDGPGTPLPGIPGLWKTIPLDNGDEVHMLVIPPGGINPLCPPPNGCQNSTAIYDPSKIDPGTLHGSNLLNDNNNRITNTNTVNGGPIDNSDLLLP